jgi:hypothetical protein
MMTEDESEREEDAFFAKKEVERGERAYLECTPISMI